MTGVFANSDAGRGCDLLSAAIEFPLRDKLLSFVSDPIPFGNRVKRLKSKLSSVKVEDRFAISSGISII